MVKSNLLKIALGAVIAVTLCGNALAADTTSKTFTSDADFSSWSLNNVEPVGSNGGLQVKKDSNGKFLSSGEATYKLTTGAVNNWNKSTVSSVNSTISASSFLFVPVKNKSVISQIDTANGQIVKSWSVGSNPIAASAGCSNDAWSISQGNNSLSHLSITDGKTRSLSLGSLGSMPGAISLQCDPNRLSANDYVWIGLASNGTEVKLDAKQFDALSDASAADATGAQAAAPIVVCSVFGAPYNCPYQSAFGANYDYLYVGEYSATNTGGVWRINVATHALDGAFYVAKGSSSLVNDWLGNIWRDNLCTRISPAAATNDLCAASDFGIAVLKNNDIEKAKLARIKAGKLCVADLNANDTNTPTSGNEICTANGYVDTGLASFDANRNAWVVSQDGSRVVEFTAGSGYASATSYKAFSTSPDTCPAKVVDMGGDCGASSARGDLVGSAIANSTSNLVVQYSSDNTNWKSADSEGNIGISSEDLYIRVRFSASSDLSPILKLLKIDFDQEKIPNVTLEKRMFSYLDGKLQETATFAPGAMVVARIQISKEETDNLNLNLNEYRAGASSGPITNYTAAGDVQKYCGLNASDKIFSSDFKDQDSTSDKLTTYSNINMDSPSGWLCYSYFISGDIDAKNYLLPAKSVLRYKNNAGEYKNVANSSNYIMVKGFPYTNLANGTLDPMFPIDDALLGSYSMTKYVDFFNQTKTIATSPSYVYKRGLGKNSRGGTLVSLPVKITDSGKTMVLAQDESYILYNPIFYIFGNIFSGNADASTAIDFSSRSSSVSSAGFDDQNKLNNDAQLYGYKFDKNSVVYWDSANQDKVAIMSQNIENIRRNGSGAMCSLDGSRDYFSSGKTIYLQNPDCGASGENINNSHAKPASSPNGGVWYYKVTGEVNFAPTIKEKGTIIFDFSGVDPATKIKISTTDGSFSDGSYLGIILINGGEVEFTKDATRFDGIIFAPGK